MASISAPRGLVPIGTLSGGPMSHKTRLYRIKSGDTVAIGNGDPVVITRTGADRGYLTRMNGTVAATTVTATGPWVGVLVGCQFTNPLTKQPEFRQHYPGSIVADDIYAQVVDDPDALFELQADGPLALTALRANAAVIQTAVTNATTGNSGLQLDASSVEETNTLPIQIVDFSRKQGNAIGDAYTVAIVRINLHQHRTILGTDNE